MANPSCVFHLPVQNVEEAVEAETGDVVAREVLNDAHFVQHDDLGNEGDGLEPQRETPSESPWRPARVQDARQHKSHWDEHLEVRECVAELIIGGAVGDLVLHEVENEGGGGDEKDLHEGVVDRDKVHEEVNVADEEDYQVDFLRLGRQTYAREERDTPTVSNTN